MTGPVAFTNARVVDPAIGIDERDPPVVDQDVEFAVPARAGIDHPASLQQQLHALIGSSASCPASRYNTAIRTATPFDTCSRMTE